jgi:hypothetical protein
MRAILLADVMATRTAVVEIRQATATQAAKHDAAQALATDRAGVATARAENIHATQEAQRVAATDAAIDFARNAGIVIVLLGSFVLSAVVLHFINSMFMAWVSMREAEASERWAEVELAKAKAQHAAIIHIAGRAYNVLEGRYLEAPSKPAYSDATQTTIPIYSGGKQVSSTERDLGAAGVLLRAAIDLGYGDLQTIPSYNRLGVSSETADRARKQLVDHLRVTVGRGGGTTLTDYTSIQDLYNALMAGNARLAEYSPARESVSVDD